MESAGSRYGVGIQGGDELHGQVWNTGSWTSLSPWFPLRLHVPAGRSRIIVRALELAEYASHESQRDTPGADGRSPPERWVSGRLLTRFDNQVRY